MRTRAGTVRAEPAPGRGPERPVGARARLESWFPVSWLLVCLGLLLAGAGLHVSGAPATIADGCWATAAAVALLPLLVLSLAGLARGRVGVDLLALLALVGAVAIGEYLAAAVLAVMVSGGRAIESRAEHRATKELRVLVDRAPSIAYVLVDGALTALPVAEVGIGDLVLVRAGDVVPVDGLVTEHPGVFDESALTGESRPVERAVGDLVRSGCTNAGAPVVLSTVHTAATSTYAGIVRMVDDARTSRAPVVRLADRIAVVFMPVALVIAGAAWLWSGDVVRAVAVLVVATPCPLILAAPVAVVSGISRAARRGVVVKDGAALEGLALASVLLLDKTGTLTTGRPALVRIETPEGTGADEALSLAASVDQVSSHVLAEALVAAARARGLRLEVPSAVREDPGRGLAGTVEGHEVAVGRGSYVADRVPDWAERVRRRTALEGLANVYVAVDGTVAAVLVLEDPVRPDAARTLRLLRSAGIERVAMVTGDHIDVAESVGIATGVDEVFADRTPEEKVAIVREERTRGRTLMVGDGINDAPALAIADVGVVMGARGATAASEAGDAVILSERLERLVEGVVVARRSRRIALQSAVVGMSLAGVAMVIAAAGLLVPIVGAVVQEAIDLVVIVYALRALGGPSAPSPLAQDVALGEQLSREHTVLRQSVRDIRSLAESIAAMGPAERFAGAREVSTLLERHVLPHEQIDEADLYPAVARIIGGRDPTGVMSREHMEIARLARVARTAGGGRRTDRCHRRRRCRRAPRAARAALDRAGPALRGGGRGLPLAAGGGGGRLTGCACAVRVSSRPERPGPGLRPRRPSRAGRGSGSTRGCGHRRRRRGARCGRDAPGSCHLRAGG